jgi:Fur family ferric uptake transcriptional regulator
MIQELEKRLKEKRVRPTAMRLLVLEMLSRQNAASSLHDLEAAFERADRITLYRTLKTFAQKGVVHSIEDGTGATKYALCEPDCVCAPEDLHVHFHCSGCEETYCLPTSKIPDINLPAGYRLQEVNLVVKGTCSRCSS